MTDVLDCHVGSASAALRSQLKSCCNDGVLRRSAGIQGAVIANEVKQSSGLLFWIATSASPPRNDGYSWIAASLRLCRASLAANALLQ